MLSEQEVVSRTEQDNDVYFQNFSLSLKIKT